ncbi:MAG TPA: hypothetical protein PLB87_11985 [Prolixibacteraceae bacterium]|nr:hypothetical protein [Prolixibacteraceae bacterium]
MSESVIMVQKPVICIKDHPVIPNNFASVKCKRVLMAQKRLPDEFNFVVSAQRV